MLNEAVYSSRLDAEKGIYNACLDVHSLSDIFHFWSNTFIRPKLEAYGFSSPNEAFQLRLDELCRREANRPKRFVSIGSGNCDLEIAVASHLRLRGHENFVIECLEINAAMLERGSRAAERAGVAAYVRPTLGDFNHWCPCNEYDAVVANQSLHHVCNLESLFAEVRRALRPGGSFIISDMIGRNGHQRWPEALEIVHEFWRKLPPSYRFNQKLGRYEELYESWDCSSEGFEGIRSQDILPRLLDEFHFHLFIPFGNIIDPFVDRAFGQNFDPAAEWDRSFIEDVHRRDDIELRSGRLKPTHMLAVIGTEPIDSPAFHDGLTPRFCVRPSDTPVPHRGSIPDPYAWKSWPHDSERELETACQRLAAAEIRVAEQRVREGQLEHEIKARTLWAQGIDAELKERTAWALRLDEELAERTAQVVQFKSELEKRTSSALGLEQDSTEQIWQLNSALQGRVEQVLRLEGELEDRTRWALQLSAELKTQEVRKAEIAHELHGYVHNPIRFVLRLLSGIKNRLARWVVKSG